MHNLGVCYHAGLGGVAKEVNKAREWLTKSAAQGSADLVTQQVLDQLNAQ